MIQSNCNQYNNQEEAQIKIYDLSVMTRKAAAYPLSALKGKVLLIVNTATGCGFPPQYEALEQDTKKLL